MRSLLVSAIILCLCGSGFAAGVSFSGTLYGNTPGGSAGGTVAADLNRDGLPDIVIADTQSAAAVSVLLATSPGVFNREADYAVPIQLPDSPVAADLNGDLALDLIVLDWKTPKLAILWNNGDGTFRNGPTVQLTNPAASFVVGNFDRSGGLDLATIECPQPAGGPCSLNIYLGHNNGTFTRFQSVKMSGAAGVLHTADLNGDSKLDLALARGTQVLLWWGQGKGTFSVPTYLTPNGHDFVNGITVADFNNDGKLDLVATTFSSCGSGCYNGSSWSYKNMGGTNFSLAWSSSKFGFAGLRRIDLNGDLNQDLIYFNGDNYNGFFLGLLGNGNGTFQTTPQSLPNPDDVADVYVRDLDLDSRDDYIVTSWLGNGAMVALQTGGYKNCKPPSSANPAAKICSPANGATVTSPVQIRAAGNSPEGIVQLQVWIDGVKRVVRWSDQLNNKFSLSPGKHRIFVGATDKWYLSTTGTTINVTVQ
jgi:hypothetical protein